MRALVVTPAGELFLYVDSLYPAGPIQAKFYAIGSGADFAIGAMERGASAEEAVRAAIVHDHHSGGEVRVLRNG